MYSAPNVANMEKAAGGNTTPTFPLSHKVNFCLQRTDLQNSLSAILIILRKKVKQQNRNITILYVKNEQPRAIITLLCKVLKVSQVITDSTFLNLLLALSTRTIDKIKPCSDFAVSLFPVSKDNLIANVSRFR